MYRRRVRARKLSTVSTRKTALPEMTPGQVENLVMNAVAAELEEQAASGARRRRRVVVFLVYLAVIGGAYALFHFATRDRP